MKHPFHIPNPSVSGIKIQLDFFACVLAEAGISTWFVSPGSRNAPLVASMIKHGGFVLHSFPDERAAAFAALGAAQGSRYPAGVICTSGTAAANLYPAVCEAYYQRLPLLVITADRPPELIDQWDGQTIHQTNLFQPHTQGNFNLPPIQAEWVFDPENPSKKGFGAPREETTTSKINRTLNQLQNTLQKAIAQTLYPVPGPVHINLPLRDPIYSDIESPFQQITPTKPFVFHRPSPLPVNESHMADFLQHTTPTQPKILVVVGMHHSNKELTLALQSIAQKLPVLADVNSKQQHTGIEQWDLAMLNAKDLSKAHQPHILITIGMGLVSKPLKLWLTNHKPRKHYHISPLQAPIGDPFSSQPIHLYHHEVDWLFALDKTLRQINNDFQQQWIEWVQRSTSIQSIENPSVSNPPLPEAHQTMMQAARQSVFSQFGTINPFSNCLGTFQQEFETVNALLKHCDGRFVFQIGNSMSIRYASWSGHTTATIFANRGTSGIDGSLSTAMGFAMANPKLHCVALLGDVSAIFDAHGLWTNTLPQNLSLVVLNNGGGQIFKWIAGPTQVPSIMPLIETPHGYDFKHLCNFYQIKHCILAIPDANAPNNSNKNLDTNPWPQRFLDQSRCTLWEIKYN